MEEGKLYIIIGIQVLTIRCAVILRLLIEQWTFIKPSLNKNVKYKEEGKDTNLLDQSLEYLGKSDGFSM